MVRAVKERNPSGRAGRQVAQMSALLGHLSAFFLDELLTSYHLDVILRDKS